MNKGGLRRQVSSGTSFTRTRDTAWRLLGASVSCALAGCGNPLSGEALDRFPVPPERVRDVEIADFGPGRSIAQPAAPSFDAPLTSLADTADAGSLSISLEEARALALENNLDLKVTLLNPTITRQSITEEEAAFESVFFANGRYATLDQPTSSTLTGSSVKSTDADAGLRIPLRTGGTITLDLPVNKVETNNSFSTLNPAYESDFSVSLSQQLLRGAGVDANTTAILLARYQTRISEAQTKLEVIRLLTDVDRAYWRLYAARKALEVRLQEFDLAKAQLERARRQANAGAVAEVEVTRAEAGVSQRVEGIITADNELRDREREFKRLIQKPDLPMESATLVEAASDPTPVQYTLDAGPLIDLAVANRMEMLELELQIASDAANIDLARNQTLPQLALNYTYNVNGLGPTWNDSFDLLADKRFEDHTVGLQFEMPIGNEAAESRLRRALLQRIQRLATRESRKSQITQEVLNAVDQLATNWQRILAAQQNVTASQRELEAEQRQFDQGLRTSTEVLDANTNLANARLAEIQAVTEYQIAQVDIAFATGLVIGASKVRWQPAEPALPE